MIQPLLKQRILPTIRRTRIRRITLGIAGVWVIAAVVSIILIAINRNDGTEVASWWPILLAGGGIASFAAVIWGWISGGNIDRAIQRIEEKYPDLDSVLVTAAEQQPAPGEHTLHFLQQDVVRRAVYHSYDNKWARVVPFWQLLTSPLVLLISVAAFVGGMITLIWFPRPIDPNEVAFDDVKISTSTDFAFTVEPGDAEVEKGTSLLVLARFASSLPPEVSVLVNKSNGEQNQLSMRKSLDDPLFGARIAEVNQPMKYQVQVGETLSNEYEVTVFEYPELIRSDAEIDYPDYTKLENKIAQDVRRVSAVEGSSAELTFHLNKSVVSATLESDDQVISLRPSGSLSNVYTADVDFNEVGRKDFRLKLSDRDNRENQDPPRIVINTLQNKVPELKLIHPEPDLQVSALEEIEVRAKSWDDFGVSQLGISYTLGNEEEKEIILPSTTENKKQLVEHLLALEELDAVADQFLTYHVWAEDIGPDGNPRRVNSDVFFAEVRRFDEIYRQGQAPPGGQQSQSQNGQGQNAQNAQQAQQLAELQKQIISATWNLIQREQGRQVSKAFVSDTEVRY